MALCAAVCSISQENYVPFGTIIIISCLWGIVGGKLSLWHHHYSTTIFTWRIKWHTTQRMLHLITLFSRLICKISNLIFISKRSLNSMSFYYAKDLKTSHHCLWYDIKTKNICGSILLQNIVLGRRGDVANKSFPRSVH